MEGGPLAPLESNLGERSAKKPVYSRYDTTLIVLNLVHNTSLVLHELHTTRRSEFSDGSSPYDVNGNLLGEIKNTGTGFTITTGSTHLLTIHFNAGRHTEILLLAGLHIRIEFFHDLLRRWTAISVRVGIHAVHHRFGVMGIIHNKRVISSVGIFDGEQ